MSAKTRTLAAEYKDLDAQVRAKSREITRLRRAGSSVGEPRSVKLEREARALVAGDSGVATEAPPESMAVAAAEAELEKLKAERDEAAKRLQAAVSPAIAEALERAETAHIPLYERLHELGIAVADMHQEVLAAAAARRAAWSEVDALLDLLPDGAIRVRARAEVRGKRRAADTGATQAAVLGFLVTLLADWSRKGSSPCRELWEASLGPLGGSVENERLVLGTELDRLRAGTIPESI